ncbi:MAG: cyclic peptide export ABC transporter [Bacteroidota bacterium]|nr:cyclic peptide export ABC transporter [Bacteroidota bacterium]
MFDFLKLIDFKKAVSIVVLGLISGSISFLFLAFINFMIGLIIDKRNAVDFNYIVLFCFLMLVFIWTKRELAYIIIKFSQRTFWKLRSEVLHTILKANFYQFNKRKGQIQAVLVNDINVLTNFSLSIIQFLSAFIITVGCFIYMGMLSKTLSLITLGVSVFSILIYWIGVYFNKKRFDVSRELENSFMKSFLDILSGFKEIHMNPKIGWDIFNNKIKPISQDSFANNIKAFTGFLNLQITSEITFHALIAFILIFNSFFIDESPSTIVNFVFILLYVLGSINSLIFIIPILVQARVAAGKIYELKKELNDERFENRPESMRILISEFKVLTVSDLSFTYESESKDEKSRSSFSVGPLSFELQKGEAIFIYGGNGSGKTTLLNAVLGILQSNSGTIRFNGVKLNEDNYGGYRTLFSVVFSDFHIFDELYGFEHISEIEINEYLKLFELDEKITFSKNSFSSNNLSTGQRKRLGLIIALVRQHPILVLDEWAADQDPVFRKKFYTQIIPELLNRGFSIIAITHDDAYYHVADKLYKMEFGKLNLEPSFEPNKQN